MRLVPKSTRTIPQNRRAAGDIQEAPPEKRITRLPDLEKLADPPLSWIAAQAPTEAMIHPATPMSTHEPELTQQSLAQPKARDCRTQSCLSGARDRHVRAPLFVLGTLNARMGAMNVTRTGALGSAGYECVISRRHPLDNARPTAGDCCYPAPAFPGRVLGQRSVLRPSEQITDNG
jgi:hypothetical protein